MIGVEGQYVFIFAIGDNEDFITPSELVHFKIVEEVGNVLPTFELIFRLHDEEILRRLNEGNVLKISYGLDLDHMLDTELFITKHAQIKEEGTGYRLMDIKGLADYYEYTNNPKTTISGLSSGIEVITTTASTYFAVDSNITESNDEQFWIQPNISDRAFVQELWSHSYLRNSFIGVGITADGKFIIRDMKEKIKGDYDWRFIQQIDNTVKDIRYDIDFVPISHSGFINSWVGYGRDKVIRNLDTGINSTLTETLEPLSAIVPELNRKATMEKRFSEMGVINDNVHENYHRAYLKNISNLALLSNATITTSFQNLFKPIKLLDLIMFKTNKIGVDNLVFSSEVYSGLYMCSKIARTVGSQSFCTTIEMCKESFNANLGDLA